MTKGTPVRYRWTALVLSLAAACAASAGAAVPAAAPGEGRRPGQEEQGPRAETAGEREGLFLDVVLNQVELHLLGYFVRVDGRMHATPQTLEELGLVPAGDAGAGGLVALDGLPGVRYDYDVRRQRLLLTVPVAMLAAPPVTIGYRPPPAPKLDPATRAPGLLLNYSVWGRGNASEAGFSGWQELRLFGAGPGVWRSSALATHVPDGRNNGLVRMDTSWQLDFPESMVSVVLGDTVGTGLDWTRSARFGGIRVSRNFGLQPYRVTMPLASFAGEAVLPSTVDLFINGIRQASQAVAPGAFQVHSAPLFTGMGNAQVVVTDITGQSRAVDFSFYNDAQMLQRGLLDWSLEAGRLRRDYGLSSFSYFGDTLARASLRYGASDFLTVEAHAEAMRGLEMGGVGGFLRLGRSGGVLSGSWATSRRYDMRGDQRGLGYEWRNRRFSVSVAGLRRDPGFRDVASLAGAVLPLRTDRAYLGVNLGVGQLGAGYVRQDLPGDDRARYATLSWSQRLADRVGLNLTANQDLEADDGISANLYLSMALGTRRHGWVSARRQEAGDTLTVGAGQPLPADAAGWGWRAQASTGFRAGGQGEIARAGRFGQWTLGAQAWHGDGRTRTTGYLGASGGLLLMQGGVFPMRRAHDAFAMVSTDGIAGVPVSLENRPVGITDERGLLLVSPLNAWHGNRLSIDVLGLPEFVSVDRTRMLAVPATASGMLARFPMRAVAMVNLALRAPDGDWVQPGAPLELLAGDGSTRVPRPVGFDGRVFLDDPLPGARLRATLEHGQCVAVLPDTLPTRGWVELGELPCR